MDANQILAQEIDQDFETSLNLTIHTALLVGRLKSMQVSPEDAGAVNLALLNVTDLLNRFAERCKSANNDRIAIKKMKMNENPTTH